jgi:hypothetical protein
MGESDRRQFLEDVRKQPQHSIYQMMATIPSKEESIEDDHERIFRSYERQLVSQKSRPGPLS